MPAKRFLFLFLVLATLACTALVGCQPAPDLNRPWHTATPRFGAAAVAFIPTPTSIPQSTPTAAAAGGSSAPQPQAVKIGVDEANPPFMYADASGKAAGLYPVLLQAIFERMGGKAEVAAYPWKRALEMGEKGEIGVGGIYKNEKRLQIYDYSDPIYSEKILVYVQKGKAFPFASPDDLKGKKVGVLTGWSYGDAFDQAKEKGVFTVQEVSSDSDNLEKLILGRVDCVVAIEAGAAQIIQDKNYGNKIEALPAALTVSDTYLVFAKSVQQGELLKAFNATLAAMRQDGSYAALTGQSAPQALTAGVVPSEPVKIGVDEANPPFMYANASGKAAGLYPVLLQAIFERMGGKAEVAAYPWKRALEMGEKGEIGVGGIYKNEKRLQIYDYSDPIYSEKILVYVQKGKAFPFASPDDLKGKKVGVLTGWSYGDAFDQAKEKGVFTVQEVSSDSDNLEKLILGRVDCVVAIEAGAAQIIQDKNYGNKIEALPAALTVSDTYLVFAKSVQQGELLKAFNATLAAMRQDGSYAALIDAWTKKGK